MAKDKNKIPQQLPDYIIDLPVPPAMKASEYLTAYKSWVYTAVNAISQEVANIDLKLYKKKRVRGEVQYDEIQEHEAFSLLEYVNDYMTLYQLIEITQTYIELLGEAYWAKIRDGQGRVSELWPLRPDWVKVLADKGEYIKGYEYVPEGSDKGVRFDKADIIPFKNLDPKNAYRGMGIVKAGAMAIDIDQFSSEWIRTFFFNSALPSLIFTTEKKIPEAEVKRFMKHWNARFKGRHQAHKVAFLGGGMKADKISESVTDMQFLEQRKMMRDEILSMFRVPKSIVGITEDVNRANAEATVRTFMANVIVPRMRKLVGYLNEFYLAEYEEDIFFDFVDPTPEDTEQKLRIYESGLQNGWLTINEVREEENRPSVQGGDSVYLPFSLQPVGSVSERVRGWFGKKGDKQDGVLTLEATDTTVNRKFNVRIPHKKLKALREEAEVNEIKHDIKKLIVNILSKADEDNRRTFTPEAREGYWRKMVAKTDVLEDVMGEILLNLFFDQKAEVLENLEGIKYWKKEVRKGREEKLLFDIKEAIEKWKLTLVPFLREVITDRAREVSDFVGIDPVFTLPHDIVQDYLENEGAEFVTQVNETTRDSLKKTLAEGVNEGEGVAELAKRIEQVYDIATASRREMIARTEIIKANNFASNTIYEQSNVVEGKEWLTSLDDQVCPICEPLDGKRVATDKSFSTVVGSTPYPPAHPRCRCTILPVLTTVTDGVETPKRKDKRSYELDEMEQKKNDLEDKITATIGKAEEMEIEARQTAGEIKAKALAEAKTLKEVARVEAEKEALKLKEELKQKATEEVEQEKKNLIQQIKDKAIDLIK
jgi:HK97 family phage portal protein